MKHTIKAIGLLGAVSMAIGLASATTCNIPSTGSIQDAITNSGCSDISVNSSYNSWEQLKITRAVNIDGNGATLDFAGATGTGVSILSSWVTIQNFRIQNIVGYAITTKDAGNVWLQNIKILNNTITNIDSVMNGATPYYPSGVGILVGRMDGYFTYGGGVSRTDTDNLNYAGLVISGNTVSNVADGISLLWVNGTSGSELIINGNTVTGMIAWRNGAGIWIDSSSYIDVTNNTVHSSYYGINITSYVVNKPREDRTTSTTGARHIHIKNNTFTTQVSLDRYDGAGVAIYGSDANSITITGNDLSNNANYGILGAFQWDATIYAAYNNLSNNGEAAKMYIKDRPSGTVLTTSGAIITRDTELTITTGDNSATFNYNFIENLGHSAWTTGHITLSGANSTTGAYITVASGTVGLTGYYTFDNLDVDSYDYVLDYATSEGTGQITGTFEIPLIAYGCMDTARDYPVIYFNTSRTNVDMTTPDEEETEMHEENSVNWREHRTTLSAGGSKLFKYQRSGSSNEQEFTVHYEDPSCS